MKKVMFALCIVLGGFAVVNAQDSTSTSPKTESQTQYSQNAQDQDRQRIQSTELPDGVKRSLEGQEYRGWLVNGAYKAKGISHSDQSSSSENSAVESDSTSTDTKREDNTSAVGAQGEEIFIVELKNGAQTKTVSFDKDGKKMEGMEDEMERGENSNINQNDQNTPTDQAAPNEQTAPNQQGTPNEQSEKSAPNEHTAPHQNTDKNASEHKHDNNKSATPKVKDGQQ